MSISTLMTQLILAEAKVTEIKHKIRTFDDGYVYIVEVLSYGRKHSYLYYNEYSVDEMVRDYADEERGIARVYTNNSNYKNYDAREVIYVSLEEIDEINREGIALSQDIFKRYMK